VEDTFYSDPVLRNSFEWYDMSREEQMETLYKKLERLAQVDKHKFFEKTESDYFTPFSLLQGLVRYTSLILI
jgi:hypothetical protein